MPTLNKTKDETKIILKWGGIALVIIFIFLMVIKFATFIKTSLTPPTPPEAAFGKLAPIPFPNQSGVNITYSLDTISGFLPNFPDREKVYKIITNPPALGALDKTRGKVSRVGFNSNETQISQDIYQWADSASTLQRRITMNIISSDFTLTSSYLLTPSLQTLSNSDEQNRAIELTISFLSSMSLLPDDLDSTKTKSILYSIGNSTLTPVSKISDAKIVRVDFFQKDLDNLPIYYEKGTTSTMDFLIGKENNQQEIVQAHYFHKNISQISSTYAIKSASLAFSELTQGKAHVASNPQNLVEVPIKKVSLGYYIGEDQRDFLMPIVIFEGDNDFIAYISAIRGEWISN